MKALLATLLAGVFPGWALADVVFTRLGQSKSARPRATGEVTSVLSPRSATPSIAALPSDKELRTMEGVEAMLARLDHASDADFKQWLRQLQKAFRGANHSEIMKVIALRWASQDPESALAFVRLEGMGGLYVPVLQEWARADMEAAFKAALTLSDRGRTAAQLMNGLDADQSAAYYRNLLDEGFNKSHPGFFGNVFASLYHADPHLAATGALEHALDRERGGWSHGLDNVVRAWLKDDPDALLNWARSQTDPQAREHAVAIVAEKWIQKAPVEGMDLFWGELNHEQRETLTDRLKSSLPEDVDALVQWVDEHVQALDWSGKLMAGIVEGLRNSDEPEKLAELLPRLDPEFRGLPRAVGAAARKWAEKDVDGLRQWIDTLENEQLRESASKAWLDHLAREDPLRAISHLESSGERSDSLRRSLMDAAFGKLTGEGWSAEEIMGQLPESLRDPAAMSYAQHHAESAPDEAMAFLQARPDGPERDRALQFTVGHWAASDPVRAAEWAETLEEGKHKEYVMRNVADSWARQDLDAAMAWLSEQPASESRERAFAKIARTAEAQKPEEVLRLAHHIEDIGWRHRTVQNALRNIARQDPDKAVGLLPVSGLSEEGLSRIEAEIELQKHFKNLSLFGRR